MLQMVQGSDPIIQICMVTLIPCVSGAGLRLKMAMIQWLPRALKIAAFKSLHTSEVKPASS